MNDDESSRSLRWLVDADNATIRSEIDEASKHLRQLKSDSLSIDRTVLVSLGRRILSLCTEAGSGEIPANAARSLLVPLIPVLAARGASSGLHPELVAVWKRQDLWKSKMVRDELEQFRPNPIALPVLSAEPSAVGAEGPTRRLDVETAEDRAAYDVEVLDSALRNRRPFDIERAEAMFLDDEIWLTTSLTEFAGKLAEPIDGSVIGTAAAALLNGRLRSIRPRIYLRFPETLIVERISTRYDVEELSRQGVEDAFERVMASPLLRVAATIDNEVGRAASLRPRKGVFKDLKASLVEMLAASRYALVGTAGESVAFDPDDHHCAEAVDVGDQVLLLRPGLRNLLDGSTPIKAKVDKGMQTMESQEAIE